jgi:hypothetical protein
MWISTCYTFGGTNKFFRISLGHESLANYFQTNFTMMHNYHYSLSELENMIPWERDVYTVLLIQHIEKENQRLKDIATQTKKR